MSLTKAQKETLELMRDTGAFIRRWDYGSNYVLYHKSKTDKYGDKIKDIRSDWMTYLRLFFVEENDKNYSRTKIYTFRPGAEISDSWLEAENQRHTQELIAKRDAEKAAIQAEQQKAADWFECDGSYTVDFSGDYFSGSGSIFFNGEFVTSFGPWRQSSGDRTFDDVIRHPENLQHYNRIKEMLRQANRGTDAER